MNICVGLPGSLVRCEPGYASVSDRRGAVVLLLRFESAVVAVPIRSEILFISRVRLTVCHVEIATIDERSVWGVGAPTLEESKNFRVPLPSTFVSFCRHPVVRSVRVQKIESLELNELDAALGMVRGWFGGAKYAHSGLRSRGGGGRRG